MVLVGTSSRGVLTHICMVYCSTFVSSSPVIQLELIVHFRVL